MPDHPLPSEPDLAALREALNTALNQWRALTDADRLRGELWGPIESGTDDEAQLFAKCRAALAAANNQSPEPARQGYGGITNYPTPGDNERSALALPGEALRTAGMQALRGYHMAHYRDVMSAKPHNHPVEQCDAEPFVSLRAALSPTTETTDD